MPTTTLYRADRPIVLALDDSRQHAAGWSAADDDRTTAALAGLADATPEYLGWMLSQDGQIDRISAVLG